MVERVVKPLFALENLICRHEYLLFQEVVSLRLYLIAFDCKKHIDESHVRNLTVVVQSKAVHVHVAQDDVLLVQVTHHRHNLTNYLPCLTFIQFTAVNHMLEKTIAFKVLEKQVNLGMIFENIKTPYDVWMIQNLEIGDFFLHE